jgi:hypothetical protein
LNTLVQILCQQSASAQDDADYYRLLEWIGVQMNHEQHAIAAVFMKLVSKTERGWEVTEPGFMKPAHLVIDSRCSCNLPCYAPRAVELYLERGGSDEVREVVGVPKAVPVDLKSLITPAQKTLVGVLAAAQGLHGDDVARRMYGKGLNELTKVQASRLIERLRKVRAA